MRHTPIIKNPFPVTPTPVAAPAPPAPPAKPTFVFKSSMLDNTVTISWSQDGVLRTIEVNAGYCATPAGALLMQQWLAAMGKVVTIFYAYPLYPAGVGNLDPESKMVPWFTDGTNDQLAGPEIAAFQETPLPNGGYTGMPYNEAVTAVLEAWGITG